MAKKKPTGVKKNDEPAMRGGGKKPSRPAKKANTPSSIKQSPTKRATKPAPKRKTIPSVSATSSLVAEIAEPQLDSHDIQGHILPGFNSNLQRLLGLRIKDATQAKAWLRTMADKVATMEEVIRYRRLRRSLVMRQNKEPRGLSAVWVALAISAEGLLALGRNDVGDFDDDAFRVGLFNRSTLLGDPDNSTAFEGAAKNWVVGGDSSHEIHILLIVASDNPLDLQREVDELKQQAPPNGVEFFYEEVGQDLPGGLAGHEHFGFKDGVSHPGVRGRLPDPPGGFVTERTLATDDPLANEFSRPGQPLVWPGQFLFGYPRQDPDLPLEPGNEMFANPAWLKNGSLLVYRRLRQDVPRFRDFLSAAATQLHQTPGFEAMTSELLAALLVGRWPSGASLLQSPKMDDPVLAADRFANNHFAFLNDAPQTKLAPGLRPEGDQLNSVPGDIAGFICPRSAHVRKVNPRDLGTELGGATRTLPKRILRRGIPFGPPLPEQTPNDPANGNRGLLFLCYQTSIVDQFEFLSQTWMNQPDKPEATDAGHDLLVGQNPSASDRRRTCELVHSNGQSATVVAQGEWVIPTGGGYFFSPSITALRDVLSAP